MIKKKPFTIYLCGPIEHVTLGEGQGWRDRVKEAFKGDQNVKIIDPYDLNIYDPECEYLEEQARMVVEDDKLAIMESDLLIVNSNGKACGTWMELLFSWEQGKPSFGFGDFSNPWSMYHITKIYDNLEDIIKDVKHYIVVH